VFKIIYGGLPIDVAQVEVQVNENQFEEAVIIIKEYEDNMLGDDAQNAHWECTNCSKMNPPSFDVCWNCQTEK